MIIDAVSHFKAAIHRSLKSGMNCNNRIDIEFRTDVFRFLFNGKGRNPPTGRGLFYDMEDFDRTYFENCWYVAHDRLGDGCSVDFPIRLESKIRWSPIVYNSDGSAKPRIFNDYNFSQKKVLSIILYYYILFEIYQKSCNYPMHISV